MIRWRLGGIAKLPIESGAGRYELTLQISKTCNGGSLSGVSRSRRTHLTPVVEGLKWSANRSYPYHFHGVNSTAGYVSIPQMRGSTSHRLVELPQVAGCKFVGPISGILEPVLGPGDSNRSVAVQEVIADFFACLIDVGSELGNTIDRIVV